MQKHNIIIDISCDKITFWPDHCQYLTVKIELREIILVLFRTKPIKHREKVLAHKSRRIVLPFSFKKKPKKVPTGRDILYRNFGVTEPKKEVTPGIKILKKKPNVKTK